jgi:amino acid adenylation domain-containing protein
MDSLCQLAIDSAARHPERTAVRSGGESFTYQSLDETANRMANAFLALGARPSGRVCLWLDKSFIALAAMQGALRAGCAYVPIDPLAPLARAHTILNDCAPDVLVTTSARAAALREAGFSGARILATDGEGGDLNASSLSRYPHGLPPSPLPTGEALAYILYTSGSTGTPKGVCVSHRAALAFVRWGQKELAVTADDVLASHAPLHFDLSVFDIYAAFAAGACVSLVPESLAYSPPGLVKWLLQERPTLWYSVPFALISMMEHGGLLEISPPMRAVLFAGEVFPIEPLKRLRRAWPSPRFLNLYGPTETNVCTFYEVPQSLDGRATPVPIGRACCGDEAWAVREDGVRAQLGEEGELHVRGPTVMSGYWGRAPVEEMRYATGDWVKVLDGAEFEYKGRRDGMLKLRGYRIEPGDVEAALQSHPKIREAAVLADTSRSPARLVAFLSCDSEAPALLEVKQHCAERLPRYMVVDAIRLLPELPRSRNGKVDRPALQQLLVNPTSPGDGHGNV